MSKRRRALEVDVLVTNAGGGRGRLSIPRQAPSNPALLQLVVEMNLFGTVYSCNAVAPIMKQQRSGKIITVSSVAGTAPSADGGYAHYGAAKAVPTHRNGAGSQTPPDRPAAAPWGEPAGVARVVPATQK
jgi:NAD(P)-dependent dehydrogenase (short-subunit alcohol dehydrogenase family)